MSLLDDFLLWSLVPTGLLILAAAIAGSWFARKRPFPVEPANVRVEQAYLAATGGAPVAQPAGSR